MKEIETLEIDGKEHVLVDKITKNDNTYYYFVEEENIGNIKILKEQGEDLISIEEEKEFNDSLILFLNKHKDLLDENTTEK